MKNIWTKLAQETKSKKFVNDWLNRTISIKGISQNHQLALGFYGLSEIMFNYFSILFTEKHDENDVMQECVMAQLKYLDGVGTSDDAFGYFYLIVKARLQSLFNIKIETNQKDYDYVLNEFYKRISL